MMSGPKDVLNDYFVCYLELSEYVGLLNIAKKVSWLTSTLKSITKPKFELQPHIALQQDILSASAPYKKDRCAHDL